MHRTPMTSKISLVKTQNLSRITPWIVGKNYDGNSSLECSRSLNQSSMKLLNDDNNNKTEIPTTLKSEMKLASISQIVLLIFATLISLGALSLAVYSAIVAQNALKKTTTTTTTTSTSFSYRWNISGTTIAGTTGSPGHSSTQLHTPMRLALDSSNALYVAEWGGHRISKWPMGYLGRTIVAGQAGGVAGVGANSLTSPYSVILDENGNFYIADTGNHRIVFWQAGALTGTTIAGVTGVPATTNTHFYFPYNLARDSVSNTLYIADTYNHRVMRYFAGAAAGDRVAGDTTPGIGATQLYMPMGICYDAASNSLIIANYQVNNVVRWVIGASVWTLVAGSPIGTPGFSSILLHQPTDIAFDSFGNLYVVDLNNNRVQLFLAGQLNGTTIAGMSTGSGSTQLLSPYALLLDKDLNLYVADTGNHRVQKFNRY